MGHNLNIINGVASFMSVKEKVWHGLGQIVEDYPTSEEAIRFAGLDYNVDIAPLYAQVTPDVITDTGTIYKGEQKEMPINFATYRKDTNDVFGVVGSRYTVLQNREAFSFFDAIVEDNKDIKYETAGALGNGEKVFITAKLPDYITVGGEDVTEKYVLLISSHDGTGGVKAMFTPTRVVCNNTLQMALGNSTNNITIRHTSNVHSRLEEAHLMMGMVNQQSNLLQEALQVLATSERGKITDKQYNKYIDWVFLTSEELKDLAMGVKRQDVLSTRKSNIIKSVAEYYHTTVVEEFPHCAGTLYGAYNSVTGYFQNVKDYKGNEEKFKTNFLGPNAVTMKRSLDLANEVVNGQLVLN